MKIPKRKLFLLIIFAYVAFSLYAAYNVFFSTKVISRVHRVVKKEGLGNDTDRGLFISYNAFVSIAKN